MLKRLQGSAVRMSGGIMLNYPFYTTLSNDELEQLLKTVSGAAEVRPDELNAFKAQLKSDIAGKSL